MKPGKKPRCPYCRKHARLVGGDVIYPHRPDLFKKKFWLCNPCGAWVGIHKNSKRNAPLGRLANAELRGWKVKAHAVFDPLWKAKMKRDGCTVGQARDAAYTWLADQLGIPFKDCHIGRFDVAMCKRVIEVISEIKKEMETKKKEMSGQG